MGSTKGRTTSGVACHHRLWEAQTVEPRHAWTSNITFGQHTRLNYVGRGMPSSPLGGTNGRMTSGVACHHHLWAEHTIELRRAWHAVIALRQHKQSNDVGRCMTSPLLDSTHGQTMSGVAYQHRLWTAHGRKTSCVASHHLLWTAHTVERRRARYAITAFGKHTRSNDVGRGMPSSPLGSTNSRTTLGMACHLAFGKHTR